MTVPSRLPRTALLVAVLAFGLALVAAGLPTDAWAQGKNPKRAIKKNDSDGDGQVSRDEWPKSAEVFDQIDADGDGYLTLREFKMFFDGGGPKKKQTSDSAGVAKPSGAATGGKVGRQALDPVTKGAFFQKLGQVEDQEARGLLESTLEPIYPKDLRCPQIDHVFGEDWRGPVPNRKHTGADIPARWDEAIVAMADGEVIAKYGESLPGSGAGSFRGIQLIVRHAPADTGLPVWLYTLYSHFSETPKQEVGQRVKMGEYLGPNGKSGVPGEKREPHLHLTVNYSEQPEYMELKGLIVPVNGRYIDPVALFRGGMPMDTQAMRALPESQRRVKIAYKTQSGGTVPPGAKIIWPFVCAPW